ncbi:helix-turn-helix transcriptional regulator [Magnetospirillum aberrantis]|uniref:WYL domain-containing protein n=1 Tax=Magnetospirillum aberrantis SpK TaxID=908842 RepID=A0A7C9US23_9PROT|nr:WYL domain-containing protein [Magnetospirillum aberrantis]NFV79008.1 WYL domain-containing protein [Magnetospirillum aberrantis SpK]
MPRKHDVDALPRDKLLVLYQRLTLDCRKHFQADLAKELNCSPQTVSRLVDVIENHLGKDTYIDRGIEGRKRYYLLRTVSENKALGFAFEELSYLSTCRDLAAPFLTESVLARIDKSLHALALHLGETFPGLPEPTISFHSKGFIDYVPHLATISTLRIAITKRQVCRVTYTAVGRHSPTEYRYAPGHIVAMNGTLYVQGYRLGAGSLLQERPTTFSLHRIADVEPTGEFFRFDAADIGARRFGLTWHEPRKVQIHIAVTAADYVRDRVWSDDQRIDELGDGSVVLTVTTTSEKEISAWVKSFGDSARILNTSAEPGGET